MREVNGIAQAKIHGITKECPEGTTWMEVAQGHQKEYECDISPVRVDGKPQELHKQVKDCELSFITAKDKPGMSAYQRSTPLTMLKAFYSVAGPGNAEELMIDFSIRQGFFAEVGGNSVLDQESLDTVKVETREYVERKIPIMKRSASMDDVIELFEELGMYGKARLFRYRMVPRVNIYSIDGSEDYYYGYMVQNTGYIKHSDLIPHHYGLVVTMPDGNTPNILHKFVPSDRPFATPFGSTEWGRRVGLETVGALNDRIVRDDIFYLILIQETLQERKIAEIAAQIAARENVCSVVITGPSPPGRTIFSHRLSAQLEVIGLKPHLVAVDNYLVNHMDNPRGEHGNHNYGTLECLDMELFNRNMTDLLEGKRVELPYYNFKGGVREYRGNLLQPGEEDILVIEGIHCLNDRLSCTLPADSKFKIYTSALIQLNVDEYSHIPAMDGWFLRRMVRDARTRGSLARGTIRMWSSVRRGEKENIFPFQEEVDVTFNSVLVYELTVLKQCVQPLPFTIPRGSEEWLEAKRFLKFLDYLIGVSSEDIPKNSTFRKFIGGSCLNM